MPFNSTKLAICNTQTAFDALIGIDLVDFLTGLACDGISRAVAGAE